MIKKLLTIINLILILSACSSVTSLNDSDADMLQPEFIEAFKKKFESQEFDFEIPRGSKVTGIYIDSAKKKITIETNKQFSFRYFREDDVEEIYEEVQSYFIPLYMDYDFEIKSITFPVEELVPNVYRNKTSIDRNRLPIEKVYRPKQIVTNIDRPYKVTKGLNNRNIALWHSHGWYYNHKLDRWMWQRARLFQVVEDLGPMSFTLPYIVPMLENAGANVYLPRERDMQTSEVVIDNDDFIGNPLSKTYIETGAWKFGDPNGFLKGSPPYEANFNPFYRGLHRLTITDTTNSASIKYTPDIPVEGEYAVYISYVASDSNSTDARYIVRHLGGITEFSINQTIGGNSWYYLGTFKFSVGQNELTGSVTITNESGEQGKYVSADVVRFGGGMGIVRRNGETSNRPKFVEGARYYLQYAGMPDTLVYNINGDTLDYNDDYQSRGEWVNYLVGNPYGPNKDRTQGLGIPIDLSLAFHTDAGITKNDTTIGTLSIYSLTDLDSNYVFPDEVSRIVNRDLADILQTTLDEDIRALFDPVWNRRQLFDGRYSEAARPNVPSVLLELLSHQNFLDAKFQADPRFRFHVSRSIYKSILRFIAYQNNSSYVVQPLPITHFSTRFLNENEVQLRWKPKFDPLEVTAIPTGYVVYTRVNNGGFDNGVYVDDASYLFKDLQPGNIYSFKVTAVNDGGESFPSEILSVGKTAGTGNTALVVNAFDRVSGPASITTDQYAGFIDNYDAGVPDGFDMSYTGMQYNYNPDSKWQTDDTPGHGSSYATHETKIIAGNTYDYSYIHGSALMNAGWSFVSSSDESVESGYTSLNKYKFVDFIFGEEKEINWIKDYSDSVFGKQFKTFTDSLQIAISEYLSGGGNIFISGSYIASDMTLRKDKEHPDRKFINDVLKYSLSSNHAVKNGRVKTYGNSLFDTRYEFEFNTELNDRIYAVEAPDAINPANGAELLMRYSENEFSAATGYKDEYGMVAFGFPFETIMGTDTRNSIMRAILKYLKL